MINLRVEFFIKRKSDRLLCCGSMMPSRSRKADRWQRDVWNWTGHKRRLAKSPQLYDSVRQRMTDYESRGYIHVVTEEEKVEFDICRAWYLPLGTVLNPNEPRKYALYEMLQPKWMACSWTRCLLKRSNLLTLDCYLQVPRKRGGNFWRYSGNVGIRKQDRSALFFVFCNSFFSAHEFDVAIFGVTCSPVQSQYVKNLNAAEYDREFLHRRSFG